MLDICGDPGMPLNCGFVHNCYKNLWHVSSFVQWRWKKIHAMCKKNAPQTKKNCMVKLILQLLSYKLQLLQKNDVPPLSKFIQTFLWRQIKLVSRKSNQISQSSGFVSANFSQSVPTR